jgi:uncharacterized protein (TIGR00255 family)
MSLVSMTGFGAGSFAVAGARFRIEARSVNHKALAVKVRIPAELAALEADVQTRVRERLVRGAVDVNLQRDLGVERRVEVKVDLAAARAVMRELQELAHALDAPNPSLDLLLRAGTFLEVREATPEPEELRQALLGGLDQALDGMTAMREAEGMALGAELGERVGRLEALVAELETIAPAVYAAYEERLRRRLADAEQKLAIALDPSRLAAELVVFSDRSDITEEAVRARTHLARFREILAQGGEQGKRLDFLAQELFREVNTLGSKCQDAQMADRVVEAKVELEKIREQVANVL